MYTSASSAHGRSWGKRRVRRRIRDWSAEVGEKVLRGRHTRCDWGVWWQEGEQSIVGASKRFMWANVRLAEYMCMKLKS